MASSNTVLRPRCVSAEHSRYFTAPGGSRDTVTEQLCTAPAALLPAGPTTKARHSI
ncbi:hypothetical protein Nmel_014602 [Mimus melanotis]